MTVEQIKNRTKTVTRRFGWWFLNPGDKVQAVEKSQGLKKGEKVKKLAVLEVVSVRTEKAWDMPESDCAKEGFPDLTKGEFLQMLYKLNREPYNYNVNRIEFKYCD